MKRSRRQREEGSGLGRERANERLFVLARFWVRNCFDEGSRQRDRPLQGGAEEGKHFVVCRALDEIARAVAVCPPNYLSQLDVQCHE